MYALVPQVGGCMAHLQLYRQCCTALTRPNQAQTAVCNCKFGTYMYFLKSHATCILIVQDIASWTSVSSLIVKYAQVSTAMLLICLYKCPPMTCMLLPVLILYFRIKHLLYTISPQEANLCLIVKCNEQRKQLHPSRSTRVHSRYIEVKIHLIVHLSAKCP